MIYLFLIVFVGLGILVKALLGWLGMAFFVLGGILIYGACWDCFCYKKRQIWKLRPNFGCEADRDIVFLSESGDKFPIRFKYVRRYFDGIGFVCAHRFEGGTEGVEVGRWDVGFKGAEEALTNVVFNYSDTVKMSILNQNPDVWSESHWGSLDQNTLAKLKSYNGPFKLSFTLYWGKPASGISKVPTTEIRFENQSGKPTIKLHLTKYDGFLDFITKITAELDPHLLSEDPLTAVVIFGAAPDIVLKTLHGLSKSTYFSESSPYFQLDKESVPVK